MDDGLIRIADAKDRERVLSLLRNDSAKNAHIIEDLVRWPKRSRFYFVDSDGQLSFLHVSGHPGHKDTVLILDGDPEAVSAILRHVQPKPPFTVRETSDHLSGVVEEYYPNAKIYRAYKMNVEAKTFQAAHRGLARQLSAKDLTSLERFFGDRREVRGLPTWLRGVRAFHGVFEDGHLLAIGSSMISLPEIWNIISIETHPDHRGKGLATEVTSSLVARALEETTTVTLTVIEDNVPAIKVYEKLGFEAVQRCIWADCGAGSAP